MIHGKQAANTIVKLKQYKKNHQQSSGRSSILKIGDTPLGNSLIGLSEIYSSKELKVSRKKGREICPFPSQYSNNEF